MSKPEVKKYGWETKFPIVAGATGVHLGAQVTVSDEEVRVWICENGMSVFRLKILGGEIRLSEYNNGKQVEVMITEKKEEKK